MLGLSGQLFFIESSNDLIVNVKLVFAPSDEVILVGQSATSK
jgi:hypothetical protein